PIWTCQPGLLGTQRLVTRLQLFEHELLNLLVVTKAFHPFDSGFMAKPRQLALGVVSDVEPGLLDGAVQVTLAFQILDDAAVSVSAEGIRPGRHAVTEKRPDLFDQSIGEMLR